jgi:DNA-binding winged helix-turn-helix (wHTH) protein
VFSRRCKVLDTAVGARCERAGSAERLAAALWGEDVAQNAIKTVQVYVWRLRKALGDPNVITTTPAGYRLVSGMTSALPRGTRLTDVVAGSSWP